MKRTILWPVLFALALPLSQVIHVADADGQYRRTRERPQKEQTQQVEEEARFPNATREDRKPETSRSYSKIADAFNKLNEGEVDAAREELTELEGNERLTHYEKAMVAQGLAQVAYESEDIEAAMRYWQQALAADALPNNAHFQLMYQLAQIQVGEEQYEPALVTLDHWFTQSGASTADALALKGNILYRLERYDDAIRFLDQAIAASDDPDEALFELKMASHYEKEDYAGAAQGLEQLVARNPNEIKHQISLAQMYIELDQNDKALAILEGARTGGRLTDASHWRQLYQLLSFADKPADAAAAINEGFQKGVLPQDEVNLRALGDNLYLAEQVDAAITAYGKAAALATDGNADQQHGHLLVERERFADARTALTTAFQKGGLRDEGTAYLLLGEAEMELDNRPAARAAFQKAAGYDNSKANAETWLKNF